MAIKKRFRGQLKIAAYHPVTGAFLGSWQGTWDPFKAAKGFYSQKMVKACRGCAVLNAQNIEQPLGIRKAVIKITKYAKAN